MVRCRHIADVCNDQLLRSLSDEERAVFHGLLRRTALANDARLASSERLRPGDGRW